MRLLAALLVAAPAAPHGAAAGSLARLSLRPRSHPAAGVRVVEGFALLPAGALGREAPVHLAAGGRRLPAELRATGFHADGSVRAALVVVQLDAASCAAGARFELRHGAAPAAPRDPLEIRRLPERLGVRSGALELELGTAGGDLIPEIRLAGSALKPRGRPARLAASTTSGAVSSERETSRLGRVERAGALAASVLVAGVLEDDAGEAALEYRARFRFLAGASQVELELELAGLAEVGLADQLCLEIPFAAGPGLAVDFIGGAGSLPLAEAPVFAAALDGRAVRFLGPGGAALGDGAARSGLFVRRNGQPGLGLAVSRLRPNAPRLVEAEALAGAPAPHARGGAPQPAAGVLRFHPHAGPLVLDVDFRVRAELVLVAGRASAERGLLVAAAAEPVPELAPVAVPAEVAPGLAPLGLEDAGAAPDAAVDLVDRLLAVVDRAVLAEAGYGDYGDYRLGHGFANLEYDPAAAFLLRYLGDRDARRYLTAGDLLDHFTTYDLSRGEWGTRAGMPWMHGDEHRSLETEAGHVWADGLVLGVLLGGAPRWRAAAAELASALVALERDAAAFGAERCYGWTLMALESLLALGPDARVAEAARSLAARLVATQDPSGFFRIDRPRGESVPAEFAVAPWVTAGISVEALFRRWRRVGGADAGGAELARAVERAAGFLLDVARAPSGGYAARVYLGGELVGKVAHAGRAAAVDHLHLAAGLSRAGLVVGGPAGDRYRLAAAEALAAAHDRLVPERLTPNEACRALVAARSLASSRLGALAP